MLKCDQAEDKLNLEFLPTKKLYKITSCMYKDRKKHLEIEHNRNYASNNEIEWKFKVCFED